MADSAANLDLDTLTDQLHAQARPRSDLIVPGATGSLENAKPYVFAGRVATGKETPQQLLARLPAESPDAEGIQMQQLFPVGARASLATVAPARTATQRQIQTWLQPILLAVSELSNSTNSPSMSQ